MPEIPAEPGNWIELTQKTCGLIIDPTKPNIEEKLGAVFEPQFRASMGKVFPDALPPPSREDFARAAAADPAGLRFDLKLDDFYAGLLIGGRTLEHGLRLAEYAPRLFSLNKAYELVECELMQSELQANRTFVKRCWQRLKPLSHFLCALTRNPERMQRLFDLIGDLPTISQSNKKQTALGLSEDGFINLMNKFKDDPRSFGVQLRNEFESLVAEAEALRKLGEKRYASGQKVQDRPFLDHDSMWSVPEGFGLPKVELEFLPLTEDENAILHGVK